MLRSKILLLIPLVAVCAIGALSLGPAPVEAAPKYAGSIIDTTGDAGGTTTFHPEPETSYLMSCSAVPFCYSVGTTTATGTLSITCATDYIPPTTTTYSTDDAGLRTTSTSTPTYTQIDMGTYNAIRARPVTDNLATGFTCKLYNLPPVANSTRPSGR